MGGHSDSTEVRKSMPATMILSTLTSTLELYAEAPCTRWASSSEVRNGPRDLTTSRSVALPAVMSNLQQNMLGGRSVGDVPSSKVACLKPRNVCPRLYRHQRPKFLLFDQERPWRLEERMKRRILSIPTPRAKACQPTKLMARERGGIPGPRSLV